MMARMTRRRATKPRESSGSPGDRREWWERLSDWFENWKLVVRQPSVLANLPPRFRWEFTRRHPYYIVGWEYARRYQRGEPGPPDARPLEEIGQQVAQACLLAIGVAGEPVDPALEFEDPAFGGEDPFVISGACQPVSLRFLAELLLNALPPGDRQTVGTLLFNAGSGDPLTQAEDRIKREQGTRLLRRLPSPALNTYPLMPFFYLHVDSSQRTVLDDVRDQLRLYQRGRTLERGIRPELLASYLDVWDRREGWSCGYARRRTARFRVIARALRTPPSTVYDRYRRAFELIVGQPYSTDLWWGLFGLLKFREHLCDPRDDAAWGATPKRNRRRPPLPDAEDVLPQTLAWIREGVSDEEIAFRLRVEAATVTAVREDLEDRAAL